MTETHYIYLLYPREHIRCRDSIYKVGKTTQEGFKRLGQYPAGTRVELWRSCKDCHRLERQLINLFKEKYHQRRDLGLEYFEGDRSEMIRDINVAIDGEYNTIGLIALYIPIILTFLYLQFV